MFHKTRRDSRLGCPASVASAPLQNAEAKKRRRCPNIRNCDRIISRIGNKKKALSMPSNSESATKQYMNYAPADLNPHKDLPQGFFDFLLPLHKQFTPRQQKLAAKRAEVLQMSHSGHPPDYLPSSEATTSNWHIEVPDWCADQRNQMTGPADDGELTVKLLNSGSPAVMIDLEDSTANLWEHILLAVNNTIAAYKYELSYDDKKRQKKVTVQRSKTVTWVRPRGLHLSQGGVIKNEIMSASLFDLALIWYQIDPAWLPHNLSVYIPKSESAEEAFWWRDLFQVFAKQKGLPKDYIKCMALVESHPLAYQMEEFLFNLRDHCLGLNLGRWDYMASLIDFMIEDPNWILPNRNTIPHDVPFFQNFRPLMPEVCHKHGALAIGGMTALFPSRTDKELNDRAMKVLEQDKKNEANCLMDGAWTGHPDQNEIAVAQFPYPNQIAKRPKLPNSHPDLRPIPKGIGNITLAGTRAAVRTVIRYRNGVLNGNGASLLDGYMEDLATDRIYRLMIAQRVRHKVKVQGDDGKPLEHSSALITRLFDEELSKLQKNPPAEIDQKAAATLPEARRIADEMIVQGHHSPI
jgi:malate synthase